MNRKYSHNLKYDNALLEQNTILNYVQIDSFI